MSVKALSGLKMAWALEVVRRANSDFIMEWKAVNDPKHEVTIS